MGYENAVYRRDELYDQVWAEPVRVVAKRYGISDVALAKICKKLSVPVPGRGYWAEKEAGKSPVRPAIPKLPEGARTEVWVSRHRPDAGPLVNPEVIARVTQEKAGDVIVVPDVLADPHPLVARAAKLLRKAKPADGLISVTDQPCVNVHVAPASLDRALRVLDALIKALDARALRVEVVAEPVKTSPSYGREQVLPPNYVTRVVVDGEPIAGGLAERWRTEMGPPPRPPKELPRAQRESWLLYRRPEPVRIPTGVLALEIFGGPSLGTRRTWNDGKHQRVEKCLNDFIAELFATADAMKRHRAEQERRQREWDEEARRRREAAERKAEYERAEQDLHRTIARWRLARDIRLYVQEAATAAREQGTTLDDATAAGRALAWAAQYANEIDPVRRPAPDHADVGVP